MSIYEAPEVGGARPGGRQALGRAAQQLWAMLEGFLRGAKLWPELSQDSCTGLACCSVARHWKQFLSKLLQAFCKVICVCVCVCVCSYHSEVGWAHFACPPCLCLQARLSETCPISVLEEPSSPVLLEKQMEACCWWVVSFSLIPRPLLLCEVWE